MLVLGPFRHRLFLMRKPELTLLHDNPVERAHLNRVAPGPRVCTPSESKACPGPCSHGSCIPAVTSARNLNRPGVKRSLEFLSAIVSNRLPVTRASIFQCPAGLRSASRLNQKLQRRVGRGRQCCSATLFSILNANG